MADKLCHCRASPRLVGSGTREEPFAMDDELGYEGSPNSYHSAPLSTPPSEAPIPIPYPGRPSWGTPTKRTISRLVVRHRFLSELH